MTRRRVIASNVTAPTNRVAECVITATTSCPRFCRPRATSTALYAPIPPVTPNAINIGFRVRPSVFGLQILLGLLDLLDGMGHHFFLGDRGLLVFAHGHAWRGAGQQLPGARAGRDHE